MKFLFFLIPILLSCETGMERDIENRTLTDLKKRNLKGKVRLLSKSSFKPIIGNNGIEKGDKMKPFSSTEGDSILFNTDGNEIERYCENQRGDIVDKYIFDYNKKGLKLNETRFFLGEVYTKTSFDNADNLISATQTNSKGETAIVFTYEFNNSNQIIKRANRKSNGQKLSEWFFEYDSLGNKIREAGHSIKSGNAFGDRLFKYDKRGNIVEQIICGPDGAVFTKLVNRYDKNDNIIETINYDGDNRIRIKITFEYKYDEYQNWIYQLELRDDSPSLIVERKIAYY